VYNVIYSPDQNYRPTRLVHYSLLVYLSAVEIFYYNSLSNIDFDLLFQNILLCDALMVMFFFLSQMKTNYRSSFRYHSVLTFAVWCQYCAILSFIFSRYLFVSWCLLGSNEQLTIILYYIHLSLLFLVYQ
jgi:hypothetical protein